VLRCGDGRCGGFVGPTKLSRLTLKNISRKGAKEDAKAQRKPRKRGSALRLPLRLCVKNTLGMVVAKCVVNFRERKIDHENSRFIFAGGRHVIRCGDSRFAVSHR
jgi:hypothetical protein